MTPTEIALLGFVGLATVLVFLVGLSRVALAVSGKHKGGFAPGGEDVGGFVQRLTRAHANCYENLPIAGGAMLYAIATEQTAVTDPLAFVFLGARLAQSAVHLLSTATPFVLIRLLLFVTQMSIVFWWVLKFFQIA